MEGALKRTFRPEFLNRLDDVVVFEPLTQGEIARIADLMLEEVRERLDERQVGFSVTEAAREHLASGGYDPEFGARPLRRTIERLVENPLARRVLAGEFEAGDLVVVDLDDEGELRFSRERGGGGTAPEEAAAERGGGVGEGVAV